MERPDDEKRIRYEVAGRDTGTSLEDASNDFRFAAAVASFGMLLTDSPHAGDATYERTLALADSALGDDPRGERSEFVEFVGRAAVMAERVEKDRD